MLVVLSDIHFQDTATSGPGAFGEVNVQPSAFEHLWRQLDVLAETVQATVCATMALLPLMPPLPACETGRFEHAANDTSARL